VILTLFSKSWLSLLKHLTPENIILATRSHNLGQTLQATDLLSSDLTNMKFSLLLTEVTKT